MYVCNDGCVYVRVFGWMDLYVCTYCLYVCIYVFFSSGYTWHAYPEEKKIYNHDFSVNITSLPFIFSPVFFSILLFQLPILIPLSHSLSCPFSLLLLVTSSDHMYFSCNSLVRKEMDWVCVGMLIVFFYSYVCFFSYVDILVFVAFVC